MSLLSDSRSQAGAAPATSARPDEPDAGDALARELGEVRKQIAALELELRDKPESGFGRGNTGIARWEMARTLLQRLRRRAEELERASVGAVTGEYGVCVKCGGAIHPDRLAVLPGAVLCIRCARKGSQGA